MMNATMVHTRYVTPNYSCFYLPISLVRSFPSFFFLKLSLIFFQQGRCVICGGPGVSDAYYCKECTIQEKDRDGCPKIVNLGSSKTDLFYERKKYGFKKR